MEITMYLQQFANTEKAWKQLAVVSAWESPQS
jgi:hypothetical protein